MKKFWIGLGILMIVLFAGLQIASIVFGFDLFAIGRDLNINMNYLVTTKTQRRKIWNS